MTATMDDIKLWTRADLTDKIEMRYCIVMHDSFDHENYPVYVRDAEEFWEIVDKRGGKDMQSIQEVYDLVEGDRSKWYDRATRIDERPTRPNPTDVEVAAEG